MVAAAICDDANRVLITRRAGHVHQGGKWEFPGGKVEPGEAPRAALRRELAEELGITPLASRPLLHLHHDYGDRQVSLEVWRVDAFAGDPRALEGQPLRWCCIDELRQQDFPAANRAIIAALRLPTELLLTPAPPSRSQWPGYLDALRRSVASRGIRMVQLRAPDLDHDHFVALGSEVLVLCRELGVRLVLNAAPAMLDDLAADGVHLCAAELRRHATRPVGPGVWLSAACHDLHEVDAAARVGADFVLVSPVHASRGHPDATPLGWPGFTRLVRALNVPAYALGGMTPAELPRAIEAGAQGIAAISGLWCD